MEQGGREQHLVYDGLGNLMRSRLSLTHSLTHSQQEERNKTISRVNDVLVFISFVKSNEWLPTQYLDKQQNLS